MSLLPLILDDYLPARRWPSALVEPDDELVGPFRLRDTVRELNHLRNHLAELEKDTSITIDKDRFQANIDVQQFRPEEISVKLTDENTLTIEGKHEEKQDEHGFISRHFVRKYTLPKDCDAKHLQSKLSSDGVLSITAPKKSKIKQVEYRQIPIVRTGQPIKGNKVKTVGGEGDVQVQKRG